jgi:L-alanine-DL-glutamate epimerase-like enolase superfamily enzyme
MDATTVIKVELWPVDLPLTDPFVVAMGARVAAQNAYVRITLRGGACGYGEMAPFPEVGGEDRVASMQAATRLGQALLGQSAAEYRRLAGLLQEMAPAHPAARCGHETALVDALARAAAVPLWGLWGGADVRERETDITIPIADLDRTVALSRRWYERGFRLLKMKVGRDVADDVRRLEAVHRACPGVAFIGDGNQGYTRHQCQAFVKGVHGFGGQLVLLEQPTAREDLDSLAALRRDTSIPVAADESARSLEDVKTLVRLQAADFINIKIMKSGVAHSLEMAAYTRASGLRLMIGGMVETRVAMGCSFSLVLAVGGFEVLDLDTPLLLATDPVQGGYRYDGPRLVPWRGPGLDLTCAQAGSPTVIE